MRSFFTTHRKTTWALMLLATLMIGILLLLEFGGNALKPAVARAISARTGRHAVIRAI